MAYLKLYNPNRNFKHFVQEEKELFKPLTAIRKFAVKKPLELFILNDFVRGVFNSQPIHIILQQIYGIGYARSWLLSQPITYFPDCIASKKLTPMHYQWVANSLEDLNFLVKADLKLIKKVNVSFYKFINCNRGIRHLRYLPVRGQRTHSNAHVARYLGSGTFEFVPTRPSTKLKKLSKYSRRKSFLVAASQSRYKRLLNKNYVEFQKNNKYLFRHLAKKNKLGVFGKILKEKLKLAKTKAKLAKGNAKVGIATKVAGKAVKTKAKK